MGRGRGAHAGWCVAEGDRRRRDGDDGGRGREERIDSESESEREKGPNGRERIIKTLSCGQVYDSIMLHFLINDDN